jgi:protein O-mannosyl-transferase
LGVLAFAPVVGFGFAYDDHWTIVENTWLERPLLELVSLLASGEAVARRVPDATRPLMALVHALERRVFGLSPWGYHLVSLALYGVCCALAARLAWVLTRNRTVTIFASVFFAVSPLHAEPVAAVNYREDLFSAIGMLGALLLFITPPQRPPGVTSQREPWGRVLATGALLLFGLLGKESALAFVPLAVAVVWLVPWAASSARTNRLALFMLGLVLFVWLAWRWPLAASGDDLPLAPDRPLVQILLRTARFELQVLRHALLPFGYSPDHWRQPDASLSWAVPFLSVLAGVAALGRVRSTRNLAVGVALALAAPLACSPLLRPVNEYADRYFFLSVLGGGIVWGWALERLLMARGLGRFRRFLPFLCVPLLLPTWRATQIWRDDRSLWTAAVAITPGSPRAWAALSNVHRRAGDRHAAMASVERALAENPDYVPALMARIHHELAFEQLAAAREHVAELAARGLVSEAGLAKAKRCAGMPDPASAARCAGR